MFFCFLCALGNKTKCFPAIYLLAFAILNNLQFRKCEKSGDEVVVAKKVANERLLSLKSFNKRLLKLSFEKYDVLQRLDFK